MLKRLRNRDSSSNLESIVDYLHTAKIKITEDKLKINANTKNKTIITKTFPKEERPIIGGNKVPFGSNIAISSMQNKENTNITNIFSDNKSNKSIINH